MSRHLLVFHTHFRALAEIYKTRAVFYYLFLEIEIRLKFIGAIWSNQESSTCLPNTWIERNIAESKSKKHVSP